MKKFGRIIGEKFKMLIRGTWTGAKWSYSAITNERFFRFFIIASILWFYFIELEQFDITGRSALRSFLQSVSWNTYTY
jgi:hypothetical protein